MNKSWSEIESFYQAFNGNNEPVNALRELVRHISHSILASGLYGWTSTIDLCIAQTEVSYPYNGPYLKLSPYQANQIEFRYIDAMDETKHWARIVSTSEVIPRLHSFLAQLNWFSQKTLTEVTH